ncbi:MAG: type II secretion system F family protein [Ferrimicrobium sp.]
MVQPTLFRTLVMGSVIRLLAFTILFLLAARLTRSRDEESTQDHRLLRHLHAATVNTTKPIDWAPAARWTNLLRHDLELLNVCNEVLPFLGTCSAVGVGITSVATALILIPPLSLEWIVVAVGVGVLVTLLPPAKIHSLAIRQRKLLVQELPTLLGTISSDLRRGVSLTSSLTTLEGRSPPTWKPLLHELSQRLTHGESLDEILRSIDERIHDSTIHTVMRLLVRGYESHTTTQLVDNLVDQAYQRAHNRLITKAERQQQLIWIPVAIATLVPGMLLLFAPLVSSLKLLAGA